MPLPALAIRLSCGGIRMSRFSSLAEAKHFTERYVAKLLTAGALMIGVQE
jgi:hypothetical protein